MKFLFGLLKWLLRPIYFDLVMYITNHGVAKIPSHYLRKVFYRTFMGFAIGEDTYIFMGAWFDTRNNFRIGCNSVINQKCRIDNRGGVWVGDNVSISSEVCMLTADHSPYSADFETRLKSINIEDYVFVGTRALIMPGVTLKRGCVVCAGAVVTRDVGELSIVAGVPARQIGMRDQSLHYIVNYPRLFH